SSYADEGTALHDAITHILENDVLDTSELLGMSFGPDTNPTKITKTLLHDAVDPALDFFDALDAEAEDEGGLQFLVEKRFQMPGIPGAFGTGDLLCRTDKRTIIVDWKFGSGVPVKAEYPEEIVDEPNMERATVMRPNSQLMFYARAALFSFPDMFGE